MSISQQDVARRQLAEMDEALGRSPRLREGAGEQVVSRPNWLPAMHSNAQYLEHARQTALWEAEEARRAATGVSESAGTLTRGLTQLQESTTVAPVVTSAGRLRVTLISPGWGSSCYYSAQVLEAAVRDKVWPAGTHCFADHPTQRELNDRPERSVRDLAAVLTTDARWSGSAVVAEAQLLPGWAQTLGQPDMARSIGMSIRASAELEIGEAEGRRGRIATKIVDGQSVDFVTRAGRGGSYEVIESSWRSRWDA
ncbi:hypothetical protein [Modestobacter sp. Leaf380]|uniref:hypothetical protein n=1 Tax=Modestobacter sp. Leaf380 TaxID=1736356 RepID=UPI0007008468|nr:hypothetical protein [Modestobacter sp. Leaf380]KQS66249.1 hypothetical protein ASG41_13070 [Modestobacter sp. Leaf380]